MEKLRSLRKVGRLLVVWLLFWFVAMAAPLTLSAYSADAWSATVAGSAPSAGDCGHAGQGSNDSALQDVHAGHSSGVLLHCPMGMHAAASAAFQFAPKSADRTPADRSAVRRQAHVHSRPDVPPPGRGPPALS